jgi:hypothetical protein
MILEYSIKDFGCRLFFDGGTEKVPGDTMIHRGQVNRSDRTEQNTSTEIREQPATGSTR